MISIKGSNGEVGLPLFTDNDLANRFREVIPPPNPYMLATLPGPQDLLRVMEIVERKGFTHVVFDHTASHRAAGFLALDLVREHVLAQDQGQPPEND